MVVLVLLEHLEPGATPFGFVGNTIGFALSIHLQGPSSGEFFRRFFRRMARQAPLRLAQAFIVLFLFRFLLTTDFTGWPWVVPEKVRWSTKRLTGRAMHVLAWYHESGVGVLAELFDSWQSFLFA
eukprot:TRINITY_DN41859_c3_g1_i1.p1 TRINITY_DN41859_c3_g1~~TRINITY_DN41859_c3_g1_i1.p1  ORF type:complete len:125 (-),score=19.16 TRINITY_DN41859_c3_g1_i1:188-562(-)